MLGRGFAYSIVPLGGICSLAAFIIGLRVRNIINRSDGEISGRALAWWCIIVGGLGTLILPPLYLALAIKYLG